MNILRSAYRFLFNPQVWHSRTGVLALSTFATLLWFIIDWCMGTTFRAMSDWLLYSINLLAALILLLPWLLTRRVWVQTTFMALVDLLLLSNLMYCRTYFTAIPAESYGLISNVANYTSSIWDSFRIADIGFLFILIAGMIWTYIIPPLKNVVNRLTIKTLLACAGILAIISTVGIACRGGFYKEYDRLVQSCYYRTCGVPTYTIAGHLLYNHLDKEYAQSAEHLAEIRPWLEDHTRLMPHTALPDSVVRRKNLVLLICESLESWPIGLKVDNKTVSPYLNSLIADSTTFYAPNVLTQVGPGRSIDTQLLVNCGILPMGSTVYSMKYSSSTYPTINYAMMQKYQAESFIFTSEKPIVWNQEAIARAFGYSKLIDNRSWIMDEMIGNPAKLSDGSFLRQSVDKLRADTTIWPMNVPRMLTFVTYSGHNPFKLPDEFRDPSFDISDTDLPQRAKDYITMVHYTDSQLHTLVDYIKSRPDYNETIVVIIGDHEGLAASRSEILKESSKAREIISAGQYTPLIILNSPIPGRYDNVIGQIDIYPTLINLLGLDDYFWKGMGQSVFAADKAPFAISSMTQEIAGDTTNLAPGVLGHMLKARSISDAIIRADFFASDTHD